MRKAYKSIAFAYTLCQFNVFKMITFDRHIFSFPAQKAVSYYYWNAHALQAEAMFMRDIEMSDGV